MSDPWPTASDYESILQHPQKAFKDSDFQQCTIEKKPNGLPRPRSGNFATVYKATLLNGENWAIRVFNRRSPERRARYDSICQYLAQKKLKAMVGFSYADDGIKVIVKGRPASFPLLKMEWVSGQTLMDFARDRCHQSDNQALNRSAERWVELVRELTNARIAHGDLQHGNVMVNTAGELKLVDYDCMCVPKLEGLPTLEGGLPPYQHHARKGDTALFADMDRFSALFIFVSLKALAASPSLWSQFVEPTANPDRPIRDSLLFDKDDFSNPMQSELMRELRRSPDKKVQKWTDDLLGCWNKTRLEDIPALDEFTNDFEELKRLLDSYKYDEAVALADQQSAKPPKPLDADLQIARQRVQQRVKLVTAVQQGDEVEMQKLAGSQLLVHYPLAQPDLAIAKDAARVLPILDQLKQALQQQMGRKFVQVWDAHSGLLQPRRSAVTFKGQVDEWRQRNQLCDLILSDLGQPLCDVQRLEQTASELDRLGGHPDLKPKRNELDRIIQRGRAWRGWNQVQKQLSAETDSALVAQWNEPLFAGWPPAEAERPRLIETQRRLKALADLKQVIPLTNQCRSESEESEITRRAAGLPDGYAAQLTPRIQLAARRQAALTKAQQALQQGHEKPLVEAHQALSELQALALLSPDQRQRLELASNRWPKLQQLNSVPKDSRLASPDAARARDQMLLDVWDDGLLKDCVDAQPWRALWHAARLRQPKLEQLQAALDAGDTGTVVGLMELPELADFPLNPEQQGRIADAQQDIAASRKLRDVIQRGNPQEFQRCFDAQVLRQFAQQFEALRPAIDKLLTSELLQPAKNGLRGLGLKMQSNAQSTRLIGKVQWNWPLPRITDRCVLAVTRRRVTETDTPETCGADFKYEVSRQDYEGEGCRTIVAPMSCKDHFVVVWAMVDAGFDRWWSAPVVLGRLGISS